MTEESIIELKLRKRILKIRKLKLSISVKSSLESLFNLSISVELNYETIETKYIFIKIDEINWFEISRKEKTIIKIFLSKNRLQSIKISEIIEIRTESKSVKLKLKFKFSNSVNWMKMKEIIKR